MNRLQPPNVNDAAAFTALANNRRLASHPHLQAPRATILQAYLDYEDAEGNASAITSPNLPPEVISFLKNHYKSPPNDIAFITALREESGVNACPLCGSLHSGTLDHLLPKERFPAFSIFSKNLVPACKCNGNKGQLLVGPLPGARILHPYFDTCLSERLIGAKFEEHGEAPKVQLVIHVPSTDPMYPAISFHVDSIVNRTGIKRYLRSCWAKLCRQPTVVIPTLNFIPQSRIQMEEEIASERMRLDQFHESKNNWNSVFLTGLLDPSTSNWLFSQLTRAGRLPADSVV